jgi:hypothetical protein
VVNLNGGTHIIAETDMENLDYMIENLEHFYQELDDNEEEQKER